MYLNPLTYKPGVSPTQPMVCSGGRRTADKFQSRVILSSRLYRVILIRESCDVLPPTVLLEISRLLNTGLDMESLSICVRLCEQGINPEALSAVIKELRKASESLKVHKLLSKGT